MEDDGSVPRHSCLKLEPRESQPIFVKGTWFDSRFDLSITDGLNAWVCHASEDAVRDRAAQWDQPVSEYVSLAELYLGFQHSDSVYGFTDAGDGHKRLSWTFEKEGTKLEWRWKCQPSPNSKETTAAVLDFLMDANVGLSEEVVRKTQSFERLKVEAEKCLTQSEKIANEKMEFETAVYAKEMDIPLPCEEARAISLRMYDASRENISNQKAPKQIKAISQKLSTLALEQEKQSVSKHFMKKNKKKEERKKKKKEEEEKKSKVPRCACCASYKGKMKKEIHIWVKATKKELRRLYPELEGQWRRQQEVRRKNHLEMLAAYKKRQEEKEKEKEEEEEEEEEELEEEQKEEEIEEEELEEGPEEKQKRIEKEKEMEQQKQKEEEEFAAFLASEKEKATKSLVPFLSAYPSKETCC
ncbi:DNA repair protein XRCC4 isoform X2 [Rosa chinensis]|uniref:DNA repair protein XRCC4 isoform X2 n=1 Tax=Rosa chinensis TaxID=74649 RepID=UPI001AD945DE|nr:DNA repair protein XRCC4 isoform X2 [Rosa chinensis]